MYIIKKIVVFVKAVKRYPIYVAAFVTIEFVICL